MVVVEAELVGVGRVVKPESVGLGSEVGNTNASGMNCLFSSMGYM
jgi:hypothetical protein